MKVKVKSRFIDKNNGKRYNAGDVITINKKRYAEIQSVGDLVEAIDPPKKDEPKDEPKDEAEAVEEKIDE